MALIVCQECGKRISDTTKVCIHCGAPTWVSTTDDTKKEQNGQEKQHDIEACEKEKKQDTYKTAAEQSISATPKQIFQKLSLERQCELEREFWNVDKSAKKYRKRGKTWGYFSLLGLGYYVLSIAGLFIGFPIIMGDGEGVPEWLSFKNWEIYHLFFPEDIPIFLIVMGLMGMICVIIGGVRLRQGQGKKEIIYKKRFQSWLNLEKNIDYVPQFLMEKDKTMWNNTNMNQKL